MSLPRQVALLAKPSSLLTKLFYSSAPVKRLCITEEQAILTTLLESTMLPAKHPEPPWATSGTDPHAPSLHSACGGCSGQKQSL